MFSALLTVRTVHEVIKSCIFSIKSGATVAPINLLNFFLQVTITFLLNLFISATANKAQLFL